ncbi:MAG: ArnT family glycosyltransferase [Anaerolineales bacterium]
MTARIRASLANLVQARFVPTSLAGLLIAARVFLPPRDPLATGSAAIRDLGLTLAFLALVIGLSLALGERLLSRLGPQAISNSEKMVFGFALGSGALAYAVLGLGLVGWLTRVGISSLLLGLTWWCSPRLTRFAKELGTLPRRAAGLWKQLGGLERAIAVAGLAIALLAFINSLTPPSDYDGLVYHLLGPKLFLEAGSLYPSSDNGYINGPFTIEMLFALGMAFKDDVFPKLIHYCFGLLFVGGTYVVSRRWLSIRGSWLSVAVLLGVPTIPVWASFAYIDLGWSAFEFLALGAILRWQAEKDSRWLVLSGSFSGLALASKYLGLFGVAILGGFLLLTTRHAGGRTRLRHLLTFLAPAALIAAPWYIKNTIWFANPVYPLVLGGPGWDPTRVELYTAYLTSFGTGRQLLDYLLLPWNIYAHHDRFGSVMNQIDIPSVLFPLVFLFPWRGSSAGARALLIVALARFGLWSFGSQQIRFLLPIYPALAIGAAHIIERIGPSPRSRLHINPFAALALGLTSITLFYQIRITLDSRVVPVVVGAESREAYLSRTVRDYPAMKAGAELIPQPDRLLLLGDGRGYYCWPWCVPDPDHFRWAAEIAELQGETSLGEWFSSHNISHLLLSWEDLDFLLQHDPSGVMERASRSLIEWREAGCLQPEFVDEWAALYRVACTRQPKSQRSGPPI